MKTLLTTLTFMLFLTSHCQIKKDMVPIIGSIVLGGEFIFDKYTTEKQFKNKVYTCTGIIAGTIILDLTLKKIFPEMKKVKIENNSIYIKFDSNGNNRRKNSKIGRRSKAVKTGCL